MIRRPAAAGTFYPGEAAALARTVDELLARATVSAEAAAPKALVVPHAAYAYSGPVAAAAYALVRDAQIRRVALAGPAHFVKLRGASVPASDGWETPLGVVAIDPDLRELASLAGAAVDDGPHEPEHALEVQLPFLLRALGTGFAMLPVAVGVGTADEAVGLLERIWEQVDLMIVSTDLSHYLDDATARRVDRGTADAVVARDAGAIGDEAACGVFALRGIVELARRRDVPVRPLGLRTSADTEGDPRRVVGYGAFAVG